MKGLYFSVVVIFGSICYLTAGRVEKIYLQNNGAALKGSDIQLVCEISQFSHFETLHLYKSDTRLPQSLENITSLNRCFPLMCLADSVERYTFSADSSNVFINITNVNRSEDQKWWACAIGNQRMDLLLNVISIPTDIKYENPTSQVYDLALSAVQLKCTTGCSYPQPTISWYLSESGQDSLQVWTSSGNTSDTTLGCSDSERKYSSTLWLPKYTTYPGNVQKTVRFKCSVQSFTGLTQPLYTQFSDGIQFAVKVSSAILKYGANTVSEQIKVVNGARRTLTCDTGLSRPLAMKVWYIGTEEKQRTTYDTFVLIPDISDHHKKIYCKAFNIQPENEAVVSYKVLLDVQVQVSRAVLQDGYIPLSGQLQVEIRKSKTLTCNTDGSRPAATIVWYIGNQERQRSTFNVFTFNPESSDHNKQIYCKAFNVQPESEAVFSYKSFLFIKGMPARPRLLYHFGYCSSANTFIFVGGYNGGLLQTFVIETRANGTNNWIKQLQFKETETNYLQNEESLYKFNIMGLTPGVYYIRVLTGNEIAWLAEDLAPTIQFTVQLFEYGKHCNQEQSNDTCPVAIVGGSLSVVIVGILTACVLIMRRMTCKRDKTSSETLQSSTYDNLQTHYELSTIYHSLTPETGPAELSNHQMH